LLLCHTLAHPSQCSSTRGKGQLGCQATTALSAIAVMQLLTARCWAAFCSEQKNQQSYKPLPGLVSCCHNLHTAVPMLPPGQPQVTNVLQLGCVTHSDKPSVQLLCFDICTAAPDIIFVAKSKQANRPAGLLLFPLPSCRRCSQHNLLLCLMHWLQSDALPLFLAD
jgi:hypothetical protein